MSLSQWVEENLLEPARRLERNAQELSRMTSVKTFAEALHDEQAELEDIAHENNEHTQPVSGCSRCESVTLMNE